MLSFIKEKRSSWDLIAAEKRPVFIYGMGNGADKILKVFEEYGIKTQGVFASDEFVRGHSFRGFKVKKYSEVCSEYSDFVIVLAFAAGYDSLIEKVKSMSQEHTLYAPDVPIEGGGLFTYEYCLEHEDEINEVYGMLEDDLSKKVFENVFNYKISGKISYLEEITTPKEEVYSDIIKPADTETYVDLGAYNGDTISEFLSQTQNRYKKIIAFEPDRRNYKKLMNSIEGKPDICALNCAAWSCDTELAFASRSGRQSAVSRDGTLTQARSVDSVLSTAEATIIKMDVEGAEEEAILGCRSVIAGFRPKLMISLYHRNRDMFYLPLLIKKINPDYKFYMRHQPYIPAWETNLYAI